MRLGGGKDNKNNKVGEVLRPHEDSVRTPVIPAYVIPVRFWQEFWQDYFAGSEIERTKCGP